jgi:hypothetical protein
MKRIAQALTLLQAILLAANAPLAFEECCLPRPMAADCCANHCDCQISAPSAPQQVAIAPTAATSSAPQFAFCHFQQSENVGLGICEVLRFAQNDSLTQTAPTRFVLTHAFLI